MKALTLKQPWASLVVEGYKIFEFRSWKTNYRGKILIHAGLKFDNKVEDKYHLDYQFGMIIGEAELVDCVLMDEKLDESLRKQDSYIYGHNHVGVYGWKLENIVKYKNPIPAKGQLGLWNYKTTRDE